MEVVEVWEHGEANKGGGEGGNGGRRGRERGGEEVVDEEAP